MRADRCACAACSPASERLRASPFRRLPPGYVQHVTCTCSLFQLCQIISVHFAALHSLKVARINIGRMAKRNLLLSVDDSEVRSSILPW